MRFNHQRLGEKAQRMSAVAAEARFMLHQLALPIEPTDTIKARRERAIRRAGLSPAKGARLWYGQACSLLADEYFQLVDAIKRHAIAQKRAVERDQQTLDELVDALAMRRGQLVLSLGQGTSHGASAAREAENAHRGDVAEDTNT